ncbi:F-box DNA helicase 1-like [Haliotis rufescens]|uniref:F-box DNA helicase 1-like n=1 Tax=Haliotis rufescens TaxID=6454 RepID=UPI00201F0562|nr:F-box DNA helicase 1-like [Haliotis rufescens]
MARKRNKARTFKVSSVNKIENIEDSRTLDTDTQTLESRPYLEDDNCAFGFAKASSLISSQPDRSEVRRDQETYQGLFSSSQPSGNFTAASSLLGLTESQLETGGFQSSKGAVNSTYKRRNSKLQRAKDSAGPNQKNISSFFTKSKTHSTSPAKVKMELHNNIEENEEFVPVTHRSPSKMYSPIKQMSGAIYISDNSCSPVSSQSDNQKQSTKHRFQENAFVKKLFDGQKNLTAGQPFPKKRRMNSSSNPQSSVSVSMTDAKPSTSFSNISSKASRQTQETMYKQTYGLVGEGSGLAFADVNAQNNTNYFEILPYHLIEHIFCQLPILDLCLNSNRVCRQWNDIISDRKFVPWKKKYHMLRKGYGNTLTEIKRTMADSKMTLPSMYLKGLIRHMKDFKPVTASNMSQCLKGHPKYGWANALIRERTPECIEHEEANPWCVVTALVVILDSVGDVQAIIEALMVSHSQCTSMEVLECLYCIATFLYTFRLLAGADVWSGMHYRVFYALYLYENASVTSHSMLQEAMTSSKAGQQTIVKYSRGDTLVRLTHEQLRIVKHSPNHGDCVKIVAFAGTGKTTTLVRFTQLRPDKKFLLVVYNKSVREHAEKTFPRNVTCKTGHALAFASVGRRYAARKKLRNLKVYEISQILPSRKGDNLFVRAKFVMETINNFCSSDNDNITSAHVPDTRTDDNGGVVSIDHAAKMRFAEDAEYLWKRMKDYDNTRAGMTHDGYLKMYQLYRPKLTQYDMILIDEAQDLTPAVISILMNQEQAKILVGDPHQQIYSFRGAVNAMQLITASHTFYLTQSFRFGPEIAQVAASCLEVFKQVRHKTIVGHGVPGHIGGEKVGQRAIISRLNFTVFSEAVKKCCYSQEEYKVAFVGGTDNFGFPMIMDIYILMMTPEDRKKENRKINNLFISKFSGIADLEKYATKVSDVELMGKIRIVKTFHHAIPMCLTKISAKCVRDIRQADIIFSTAHKAKGLEFSTVQVTDDFINNSTQGASMDLRSLMNIAPIPADEANLLYVAVTRAKNALLMSPMLVKVLQNNGEKFEYPVCSDHLQKLGIPFKCRETDAEFKPQALTLRRQDITVGEGDHRKGGVYGPQILSENIHRFAELLGDPSHKPKAAAIPHAVNVIVLPRILYDQNGEESDEENSDEENSDEEDLPIMF